MWWELFKKCGSRACSRLDEESFLLHLKVKQCGNIQEAALMARIPQTCLEMWSGEQEVWKRSLPGQSQSPAVQCMVQNMPFKARWMSISMTVPLRTLMDAISVARCRSVSSLSWKPYVPNRYTAFRLHVWLISEDYSCSMRCKQKPGNSRAERRRE